MDDLALLKSRVEAARDRLGDSEADQRKYGLRLDDLVRIVEGALSRQLDELNAAKAKAAALEIELEVARNAVSRHELDLVARETDLAKAHSENEQLRTMVMALLELVEGRNVTPMREAMVRLEKGVRGLLTGAAPKPAEQRVTTKPQPTITPRPVLVTNREEQPREVQPREIQSRISPAELSKAPVPPVLAPVSSSVSVDDALVELTSLGRSNSSEIVKDPPGSTPSALSFARPHSTEM
ncbi:MAG TPA: hypothetical protein VGM59_01635 [Dongiaceae bacterium]